MINGLFVPRHKKRRSLRAIKHIRARYELAKRMLEGQAVRRKRTLHTDLRETIKRAGDEPG